MGKASTKRLTLFVNKILEEKGPLTTGEILDAYNKHSSWGTNMNILGNVLSREAVRIGYIGHLDGVRIRNAIWHLKVVENEQ